MVFRRLESTAKAIPGLGKFDLKSCFNLARMFGR